MLWMSVVAPICWRIERSIPSPTESTDTSAAVPMTMPSVERIVRSGFVRNVSNATDSEVVRMGLTMPRLRGDWARRFAIERRELLVPGPHAVAAASLGGVERLVRALLHVGARGVRR